MRRVYKVWALRDYSCLHEFPAEGAGGQVADVKISPGAILLIQRQRLGRLPVRALSVQDGAVLAVSSAAQRLGRWSPPPAAAGRWGRWGRATGHWSPSAACSRPLACACCRSWLWTSTQSR